MANPPDPGKWNAQEEGLLVVTKQFAASMCGGPVDDEVRAQLQIQHDIAATQLAATAVSEQAAAKTSWKQWAANAVDGGASAAHAYLRRADAKIESDAIRSFPAELAAHVA